MLPEFCRKHGEEIRVSKGPRLKLAIFGVPKLPRMPTGAALEALASLGPEVRGAPGGGRHQSGMRAGQR